MVPPAMRRMVRGSEAKGGPLVPPATDGWCEEAKQRGDPQVPPATDGWCEEAKQRGDPWSLRQPTDGARKRSKGGILESLRRSDGWCEEAIAKGGPLGPSGIPTGGARKFEAKGGSTIRSLRQPTGGARKRSKGGTLGPSGDRRVVPRKPKQRGDPWSLTATDGWCEEAKQRGDHLVPPAMRRMVRGSEAKGGPLVPPATDRVVRGSEAKGGPSSPSGDFDGWCEDAKQRGDPWSLRRPTGGVRWNARALGASERSCIIAERLALCIRDVPRSSPCASTIRFAAVEILIVGGVTTEGCRTIRTAEHVGTEVHGKVRARRPSDSPSAYGTFLEVLRVHPRSGLQPVALLKRPRPACRVVTIEAKGGPLVPPAADGWCALECSSTQPSERSRIIAKRLALRIRDVPGGSPCASTIRFAAAENLKSAASS